MFLRGVANPSIATGPTEILREHPHTAPYWHGLLHGALEGGDRTAGDRLRPRPGVLGDRGGQLPRILGWSCVFGGEKLPGQLGADPGPIRHRYGPVTGHPGAGSTPPSTAWARPGWCSAATLQERRGESTSTGFCCPPRSTPDDRMDGRTRRGRHDPHDCHRTVAHERH